MSSGTAPYLAVSATMFVLGVAGFMARRNVLVMFMCIELMLNAANVAFVAFAKSFGDVAGQIIVFFVMVAAAVEVVVGLAIIVAIYSRKESTSVDDLISLRG